MGSIAILWLKAANRNLDEIAAFIANDNPSAAQSVVRRVRTTVELLSEHPSLGRISAVPGARELVIRDTSCIVVYRFHKDVLEILRVYHKAQKRRSI